MEKNKMGRFEKLCVFATFILASSLIGFGVDRLTGVSFKDDSSVANLANQVFYMLDGMVLLQMIKWLRKE